MEFFLAAAFFLHFGEVVRVYFGEGHGRHAGVVFGGGGHAGKFFGRHQE